MDEKQLYICDVAHECPAMDEEPECKGREPHARDECGACVDGCQYAQGDKGFCVPVEQATPAMSTPVQIAQRQARDTIASFGQYPICPHCGHTDRPVCCIPVEQPAAEPVAEPPTPLDLWAIKSRHQICGDYNAQTRDDIQAMIAEIEQLCQERDGLQEELDETKEMYA